MKVISNTLRIYIDSVQGAIVVELIDVEIGDITGRNIDTSFQTAAKIDGNKVFRVHV
jgi:hypothetical protein